MHKTDVEVIFIYIDLLKNFLKCILILHFSVGYHHVFIQYVQNVSVPFQMSYLNESKADGGTFKSPEDG